MPQPTVYGTGDLSLGIQHPFLTRIAFGKQVGRPHILILGTSQNPRAV